MQAHVLITGPFMAYCVSRGFVLSYNTEFQLQVPICDDWVRVLYEWIPRFIAKMKSDLIDIGAWEISNAM